jgi:hypothetical protein
VRKSVVSEYQPKRATPARVERWEQQIMTADDPTKAQTQMLYVLAVEQRKLRLTLTWALGVFAAVVVLWALLAGFVLA